MAIHVCVESWIAAPYGLNVCVESWIAAPYGLNDPSRAFSDSAQSAPRGFKNGRLHKPLDKLVPNTMTNAQPSIQCVTLSPSNMTP